MKEGEMANQSRRPANHFRQGSCQLTGSLAGLPTHLREPKTVHKPSATSRAEDSQADQQTWDPPNVSTKSTDVFGASRGPMLSADGLASVTGMAKPCQSRIRGWPGCVQCQSRIRGWPGCVQCQSRIRGWPGCVQCQARIRGWPGCVQCQSRTQPSADGPGHPRIIHLIQNRLPCIAKNAS